LALIILLGFQEGVHTTMNLRTSTLHYGCEIFFIW